VTLKGWKTNGFVPKVPLNASNYTKPKIAFMGSFPPKTPESVSAVIHWFMT